MDTSPLKKLEIPKKYFIELMKLKEKESQKVDASVLLRRKNKTLMGGNILISGTFDHLGLRQKHDPGERVAAM